MKRIVTEGVAEYVGQRCGVAIQPPFTALGIEKHGEIILGVVFNGYNGSAVEITVAGQPEAVTRAFLRFVGQYVFGQLGCLRASFTTQQDHVINLIHRLGGQTEGRKRNHFGAGRDGVVLGILREEWKL